MISLLDKKRKDDNGSLVLNSVDKGRCFHLVEAFDFGGSHGREPCRDLPSQDCAFQGSPFEVLSNRVNRTQSIESARPFFAILQTSRSVARILLPKFEYSCFIPFHDMFFYVFLLNLDCNKLAVSVRIPEHLGINK